ncbi:CLUMA_CG010007, isoform A [Clunio marinus]|uniref:procollagen-proline 4-dioxygenase n=1 Tax=Clunio marinus TaxID=568069 RepID=A0A1J1I908_9DIPT|nr:CLUMA_CG010007, isoform A [Clunio marinus]
MKILLLLNLFTIILFKHFNCEIFSAIDELEYLAESEKYILHELGVIRDRLNDSYITEKFIAWLDEVRKRDKEDVMTYITNPLNAFLMIKRTTSDTKLITKKYPEESKDFLENIKDLQPTADDLSGAVEGLLRLQYIYKLKSVDFANGVIDGVKTRPALSPHDLFVIGDEAYKLKGKDYFVEEYLVLAYDKVLKGLDPLKEVNVDALLLRMSDVYNRTGDFEFAIHTIDEVIKRNPTVDIFPVVRRKMVADLEKYGNSILIQQEDPFKEDFVKDRTWTNKKEEMIFSQTCRGKNTKSPKEMAELKCRYVSNTPYVKLFRFKLEEANSDPYIVLFLDVVTDNEIFHLIENSKSNFARATTYDASGHRRTSKTRIAKSSWHYDHQNEIVKKISQRIEHMTGLSMTTSEGLQIQNYGIGGHYVPHWDHQIQEAVQYDDGLGNRVATTLIYFTDVEKGGYTVFPYLKVRIPAVKGSAAFWYNLKENGQGDYRTRHAGCPVLIGSKWVANKWIREAVLVSFLSRSNCEIFSAIDELENLAVSEKTILGEIANFTKSLNDSKINKKIAAWQNEYKLVEKDVLAYITNPLNAFLMVKRTTSDVELITKHYKKSSTNVLEKIKDLQPTADDLSGAVEGLMRLQYIYKLKSEDFANGIIDGIKTRSPLAPHDLYVIGDEAAKIEGSSYFAKEYLELTFKRVKAGLDPLKEVNVEHLLLRLYDVYSGTGDFEKGHSFLDELLARSPGVATEKNIEVAVHRSENRARQSLLTTELDPFSDYYNRSSKWTSDKEKIVYSQVCRGNLTKTNAEIAQLKCRYVSKSAFSKLARFKIEEANLHPYIVVFHDVLSDDEIEFLKVSAKPNVHRAGTLSTTLDVKKTSSRVAKLSWLPDEKDEIINRISQRVEDMTGLTMSTSEMLQVQNYGIGGHYVPHWDHTVKGQKAFSTNGNRIATTLFYLTDVPKGGYTIFIYLKVRVSAVKGSAVFWYNIRDDGQGDYRTRHAACPVLIGTKWVANKWIKEYGQEFRRPCPPGEFKEVFERDIYIPFLD